MENFTRSMNLKIYAQSYSTDKLIKITDKLNLIQDIKMKRIKKKVQESI